MSDCNRAPSRPCAGLLVAAVLVALALASCGGGKQDRGEVPTIGTVPERGELTRWVSPRGSDTAPGTRARPWRTLHRAVAAARPGMTVVLEPGTYGSRGQTTVLTRAGAPGRPITYRGRPGAARPRILGAVRIRAGHQRLAHLLFDGPTGPVQARTAENPGGEQVQIAVDDNDTVRDLLISDCEIRNSHWHAGIYLENAEDVAIVGNHIHDNGDRNDPGQANMSHGIYWASGSGTIARNLVEHNVARGIQLYPRPAGVVVAHNTIVGNGRAGVQVANDARDTLIVNNIIVGNGDRGIRSSSLDGDGNVARTNLEWNNGTVGNEDGTKLRIEDTIEAPPDFAGRGFGLSRASKAVDRVRGEDPASSGLGARERTRGRAPDLGAYESW